MRTKSNETENEQYAAAKMNEIILQKIERSITCDRLIRKLIKRNLMLKANMKKFMCFQDVI